MSATTAIQTSAFIASIGVNIHAEYTDGKYADTQQIITDLNYLGISLVRDGNLNPSNQGQSNYDTLANAGIKFDLIINGNQTLAQTMTELETFATAHPGAIVAVEGPNEIDHSSISYDGLTGAAAANQLQIDLYAAIQQSSLAGISVYSYSLGSGGTPTSGYTAAALHPYPQDGDQPLSWLENELLLTPAGKSSVITELGYSTLASNWDYGVDDATQAKETINALLDATKLGVGTTYLYELLDAYADPTSSIVGNHYGLFNLDGTAKPVAVALHDLTTILADTGATATTFTTGSLNFTLTNLPTTGDSLLMEKSNGAFDLVVWNEPTIWNASTHSEVAAATTTVGVSLGATYATVEVFDVLDSSTPIEVLHNVSQLTLALSDEPYIIEIEPGVVNTIQDMSALAALIPGTVGADLINVTLAADTVFAGAGDDTIYGSASAEQLYGNAGNDIISLTAAGTVFGGAGNDVLTVSGSGAHYVSADMGDDTVISTTAGDSLFGGMGNDSISAMSSTTVYGGKNDDHIVAVSGQDFLSGDMGNDTLSATGTTGGDTFVGGMGADSISVDAGHLARDVFIVNVGDSTAAATTSLVNGEASLDHIAGFNTALDELVLLGHNDLVVSGSAANETYVATDATVYATEASAYSAAYAYAFSGSNFAAGTEYLAVHENYAGSTNGTTYLFTHNGAAIAFDGLAGNVATGDVLHAA